MGSSFLSQARGGMPGQQRQKEPEKPDPGLESVQYAGVVYDRKWDPYSEAPHEPESEAWFVEILQPLIHAFYPPDRPLPYNILLPALPETEGGVVEETEAVEEIRLLSCFDLDKKDATWKEFHVLRDRGVVHVWNLVSHGRRMYRSLQFSTHVRFALHSLPRDLDPKTRGSLPPQLADLGGDFRRKRTQDPSLVVIRHSEAIGGTEQYLPPRLLQGVIPSVLLENYDFWRGEDGIIRGTPQDEESQWFGYRLEIELGAQLGLSPEEQTTSTARGPCWIRRRVGRHTRISQPKIKLADDSRIQDTAAATGSEQKQQHSGVPMKTETEVLRESLIPQIVMMGFPEHAARLAVKMIDSLDVMSAVEWLTAEQNQEAVAQAEIEAVQTASLEQKDEMEDDEDDDDDDEASEELPSLRRTLSSGSSSRLPVLLDEGWSVYVASRTLSRFGGDLALAQGWLRDPENLAEIDRLQREEMEYVLQGKELEDLIHLGLSRQDSQPTSPHTAAASGQVSPKSPDVSSVGTQLPLGAPQEEHDDDLTLLNLLDAKKDSELYRLATLMARIEDLSHVLAWTTTPPSERQLLLYPFFSSFFLFPLFADHFL